MCFGIFGDVFGWEYNNIPFHNQQTIIPTNHTHKKSIQPHHKSFPKHNRTTILIIPQQSSSNPLINQQNYIKKPFQSHHNLEKIINEYVELDHTQKYQLILLNQYRHYDVINNQINYQIKTNTKPQYLPNKNSQQDLNYAFWHSSLVSLYRSIYSLFEGYQLVFPYVYSEIVNNPIYNILERQMIELIITAIILGGFFLFYKFWIKPQRIIRNYAKILRGMGYKVLEEPYHPFKHDLIQAINRGVRQGDAMKVFKEQRGQYDVIVTNSMNRPKLEFNHPDFIKDFYSVDKHYQYPKEQKVVNLITRASGRNQLSSSQGPEWKRKRTVFNKIFNFDFIKSQAKKIAGLSEKAILDEQSLGKKIEGQNAVSYNIFQLATRIFSEVVMEIFLGGSKEEYIDGQPAGLYLSRLIEDSSKQILRPINYILGIKFIGLGITKQQRQMNQRLKIYKTWALEFVTRRVNEITQILEKDPTKNTPSDIIQGLIMANRKAKLQNSDEDTISAPEEIVDDFTSFFIAGIQTTATYTQMMIYYLAIYPHIEAKVRKEIQQFMGTEDYSFENLKNLTYIDLLQKETTRYFGPGTQLFPRIANVDNYINGLPILKGTQVLIMHMGNHHSEKYFKDPKIFRPERWENQCNEIPPFVCGGFSAGARSCIGKHLAMLDSKIALVKFLKRYKKVTLPKNEFKIGFTFSVYPEQFDVLMILDERSQDKKI